MNVKENNLITENKWQHS